MLQCLAVVAMVIVVVAVVAEWINKEEGSRVNREEEAQVEKQANKLETEFKIVIVAFLLFCGLWFCAMETGKQKKLLIIGYYRN